MFYIIYKVTNIANGKIYIGKHETVNIADSYLGSGIALKRAIKKYGKESFKKEILHVFKTAQEMDDKERELVTEEFVARKDTYNMGIGGEGGPQFKGRKHSSETKEKLRQLRKSYPPLNAEARAKISQANRNRYVSDMTRQKISHKARARYVGDGTRQKISDTMTSLYASGQLDPNTARYERTGDIRAKTSSTMITKYRELYKRLIWVKNLATNDCQRIDIDQLDEYIGNGYIRGRIIAG